MKTDYEVEGLFSAVEACVQAGWTVEKYVNVMRDCWEEALREKLERDVKVLAGLKS